MAGLFQSGVPSLSGLSTSGVSMAPLGSIADFTASTPMMSVPQGMNLTGLLGLAGSFGGGQQPAPMLPPAPAPQIRPGGDPFAPFYTEAIYQPRQTAQALSGLLGGAYGIA